MFVIWNFVSSIKNTYFQEMVRNEVTNFCILETNPLVFKFVTQDLVNDFHLYSKDQVPIVHRKKISDFSKLVTFDVGFIQFPLCTGCILCVLCLCVYDGWL